MMGLVNQKFDKQTTSGKYIQALADVYLSGQESSPRGMKIRELEGFRFHCPNAKDNVIVVPGFETNIGYAEEEVDWYLSGSSQVDWSDRIKRVWLRYSDDGETVNSNYGERIFGLHPKIKNHQWNQVLAELKRDPDSRRAVINLNSHFDKNDTKSKDVPCTIGLQYMIRKGKLDSVGFMRSNDLVLGFRNDLYCFTELQRQMGVELGLETGSYTHLVGSAHLYEKDFPKVRKLLSELIK